VVPLAYLAGYLVLSWYVQSCILLQCVAVCCSVLQLVTLTPSGLIGLSCGISRSFIVLTELYFVAVCCSVLQCVAVCCSVLQLVTLTSCGLIGLSCGISRSFIVCTELHFVAACCSVL